MDQTFFIITIGLLILAIVSGMVGLGVAFAAVPFLSLFMTDLVHQVQPLTLMLNGLGTAVINVPLTVVLLVVGAIGAFGERGSQACMCPGRGYASCSAF